MDEKFTDNNENGFHNHSLAVTSDKFLSSQCTLKIHGENVVRDTGMGYGSFDKVLAVQA